MKWFLMYSLMGYLIACADSVDDGSHGAIQRVIRVLAWPITLNSLFVSHNNRLHRLLTSLWTVILIGWILSLIADRL